MSSTYGDYARVYDSIGQSSFSLGMVDFVTAELARTGIGEGRLVDLACGTGSAAIDLARRGFSVTGVDSSPAMLREARRKAREAGIAASFLEMDMRYFALDDEVDVATCLYDSLNYLLRVSEVASVIERVGRALRPGGVFVFDFNTPYQYERLDGRDVVTAERDDLFGVYRHRYDGVSRLNEVLMTFFQREGGLYRRWEERHVQRAYAPDEMRQAATSGGFIVLRAVPLPEDSEPSVARRWAFVCTKG